VNTDVPESLKRRPVDERRGLPVPAVSEYDDPETGETYYDFTAVNGMKAVELGQQRRCGLCGEPMDYWVVFLGGPKSAEARTYVDPPMHPECGEAALHLCPHIAKPKTQRTQKHKAPDVITPEWFVEEKPQVWVMLLTRRYKLILHKGEPVFLAAPPKALRRFEYSDEGVLEEVG
jgi:hypothetical protein